jgi:hypothetical protein
VLQIVSVHLALMEGWLMAGLSKLTAVAIKAAAVGAP